MKLIAGAAACTAFLALAPALAPTLGLAARGRIVQVHYACSAPNSAHVPCHFSTPSGNIRCLWTPRPNSVACELLSSGRAYRLRPSGRAKAIKLRLARHGETLPTSQEILFTESLSCHDTRRTMTCNQDYGEGEFTLAPGKSHSA